jgi:hypothetical protein
MWGGLIQVFVAGYAPGIIVLKRYSPFSFVTVLPQY